MRLVFLVLLMLLMGVARPVHAMRLDMSWPVPSLNPPDDVDGLWAQWTWNTSHATNLGQIDWADCDEITVVDQINWPNSQDAFLPGESSQYFALRLTGRITIPEDGTWGFFLGSDEAAALWIDGQEVVYDGTPHSYRQVQGGMYLAAGTYDIEVRYLERSWTNGLVLEWTRPDLTTEVIPASAFSHNSEMVNNSEDDKGLQVFWSSDVSHATNLWQVDWHRYTATTREDNVSWRLTHGSFYLGGPTQYFAARMVGKIIIPEGGTWTFRLGSDEAASLHINGVELINDGETHSFGWASGSVTLTAGEHDIDIRYLERSWTAGLFLTWQGPSDSYESVVPQSALIPGDATDLGSSGTGGLTAYWTTGVSHATNTGQIEWEDYTFETTVPRVSWDLTHGAFDDNAGTQHFALRLFGKINIPEDGWWTFNVGSDESVEVWIDGSLVIYDSSTHSYRWKEGTRSLTAGLHDIDIRFLERSWTAGLHLTWQGPSDDHEVIVPTSAFTATSMDTGAGQSNGIKAYWTSDVSHATNLGQIDWNDFTETTTEMVLSWPLTHGAFYTGGPTQYFAARLLATIEIPATGSWTFNLGSDEAASLWIDGEEIIYDGTTHSHRWSAATVTLEAGPHEFEVRYLERSWTAGLTVTWKGPTVPYEDVIPISAFTPRSLVADSGEGLRAFWTTDVSHASRLGYIDWYDHTSTTIVDNISWRLTHGAFYDGGPTQYFAGRFLGTIEIPTTGTWEFNLGSDEAAALYIDGEEVVYDGTTHSFRWRSGSKSLSAGPHTFDLRYLERSWTAGLFLTWKGPGDTHEQVIPVSAFTPAADDAIEEATTGSITAYWDSGVSHASNIGHIDWQRYSTQTSEENISWRLTHGAFYLDGPTQYFTGRFYGTIEVPESGEVTFHLGSDEAAELRINGETVVSGSTTHSWSWASGSVTLTEGTHTIDVRYLERSWTAGLFLAWTLPGETHPEVVPSSALSPATAPVDSSAGMQASWYNSYGASSLSAVDWTATPLATTDEPNTYWPLTHGAFYAGGPTQDFAGSLTGTLIVPETGFWTFSLGSDEGAELRIDGSTVVSDPSSHSYRWTDGSVYLTAGNHPIEVRYLERSWTAGLVLTWQGPSDDREAVIPPGAFVVQDRLELLSWTEVDPSQ
ncbi:MAG: PA14 domain-containing protein [Planctomycetota bacterium]|nr:PA14 domain-containing protein [Planctomycetota bacterium]